MDSVKLARSIVGDNPEGRPELDFYPTPPSAVHPLLDAEIFGDLVWEPACGDGAIVNVLKEYKYAVAWSDIKDYGFPGTIKIDFLNTNRGVTCDIVTNPPFNLFSEFVAHCNYLGTPKFAMFGKLSVLEGDKRSRVLEQCGLYRVYVFRKRVSLSRNGNPQKNKGMIAFAWYVFRKDRIGCSPSIAWI